MKINADVVIPCVVVSALFGLFGTLLYTIERCTAPEKNDYTIPDSNFRNHNIYMKPESTGWMDSDAVQVDNSRQAWMRQNKVYPSYDSYIKVYSDKKYFAVFVVAKEDHHEVYLPKEYNNSIWSITELRDRHKEHPVKMIPTEVPISAFDEALQMGLMGDVASFVKEYTPSTLIAENGVE